MRILFRSIYLGDVHATMAENVVVYLLYLSFILRYERPSGRGNEFAVENSLDTHRVYLSTAP